VLASIGCLQMLKAIVARPILRNRQSLSIKCFNVFGGTIQIGKLYKLAVLASIGCLQMLKAIVVGPILRDSYHHKFNFNFWPYYNWFLSPSIEKYIALALTNQINPTAVPNMNISQTWMLVEAFMMGWSGLWQCLWDLT
jgi:hypothetical protein